MLLRIKRSRRNNTILKDAHEKLFKLFLRRIIYVYRQEKKSYYVIYETL